MEKQKIKSSWKGTGIANDYPNAISLNVENTEIYQRYYDEFVK